MKYLVVVRHAMDDIPIHLCDDRNEALARAGAVDPDNPEHSTTPEYWGVDASTPMFVAIVTFGDDGKPVSVENVRNLDEESDG